MNEIYVLIEWPLWDWKTEEEMMMYVIDEPAYMRSPWVHSVTYVTWSWVSVWCICPFFFLLSFSPQTSSYSDVSEAVSLLFCTSVKVESHCREFVNMISYIYIYIYIYMGISWSLNGTCIYVKLHTRSSEFRRQRGRLFGAQRCSTSLQNDMFISLRAMAHVNRFLPPLMRGLQRQACENMLPQPIALSPCSRILCFLYKKIVTLSN